MSIGAVDYLYAFCSNWIQEFLTRKWNSQIVCQIQPKQIELSPRTVYAIWKAKTSADDCWFFIIPHYQFRIRFDVCYVGAHYPGWIKTECQDTLAMKTKFRKWQQKTIREPPANPCLWKTVICSVSIIPLLILSMIMGQIGSRSVWRIRLIGVPLMLAPSERS